MKNSHIEWTDHTFNPWIGCTKVSPGCANCYAEARDQRFAQGKHWGKGAPRQRTSAANWKQPLKWNEDAAYALMDHDAESNLGKDLAPYVRPRVFCASLADWLDEEVPIEWLIDLLTLIDSTPNLDWLLLTKRPENFVGRITAATHGKINPFEVFRLMPNIWVGTTVEDQARADARIPALLAIPAKVRFLSCEPLLDKVDLTQAVYFRDANREPEGGLFGSMLSCIDWVICGGESGSHARPMHPAWARTLRDQCQAAEVAFFFKQWGEWIADPLGTQLGPIGAMPRMLRVGKQKAGRLLDGREWSEFPKVEVST